MYDIEELKREKYEEMRLDALRDEARDRQILMEPDACGCSEGAEWKVTGRDDAYGADRDGNRGCLLIEYECSGCGNVEARTYG